MSRILVVEDDADIASLIVHYLGPAGHDSEVVPNGSDAVAAARRQPPDLVILDRMLPGLDGLEICRALRADADLGAVPILMLTARAEEVDRIAGFETGADDYVTKPFSPKELVARVAAVMRRVRPALAGEQLSYADLEMDVTRHRVRRNGEVVTLGPTEFRLLKHFLEHPGRVFSREQLLDSVWTHDPDIDARTVDVHVRRLRQALNGVARPDLIRTVRSAGYSLDVEG